MHRRQRRLLLAVLLLQPLVAGAAAPPDGAAAAPDAVRWFQATAQALVDAVATGDRSAWDAVMDPSCVITTEEGEILDRKRFLEELRPLPAGLQGRIAVRELAVQDLGDVAVVRYLLDEREVVFGQTLATRYRATDTYRRARGGWKLVASHSSVVTQDPPAQRVATSAWPSFAGTYRLLPAGWTMAVELRDGKLLAGPDPARLRAMVPVAQNAFVRSGLAGEWIFGTDDQGQVDRIVELRKSQVLIWTKVPGR